MLRLAGFIYHWSSVSFHPHTVIGANINEKATRGSENDCQHHKTTSQVTLRKQDKRKCISFGFAVPFLNPAGEDYNAIIACWLFVFFTARAEKAAGHHWAPPAETGALCHVQQQQVVPPPSFCLSVCLRLHGVANGTPACSTLIPMPTPTRPISSILPFPPPHVCATRTMQTTAENKTAGLQHQWLYNHTTRSFGWLLSVSWVHINLTDGSNEWPIKSTEWCF